MDTNRAVNLADGASIRLRYSTQLKNGGHTQTIDAEISIPVGASQEMREQIIHEAEVSVEQLAQQIALRGARSGEVARPQQQYRTPSNGSTDSPISSSRAGEARSRPEAGSSARPPANASLPASRTSVGESMPGMPTTNREGRTIRLVDFINAIHKHLDLSPKEAIELLKVKTLDGLNYMDAFKELQSIVGQKNGASPRSGATTRSAQSVSLPSAPDASRQSTNGSYAEREQSALEIGRTVPPTRILPSSERTEREPAQEFAGSPKAPIPLHIGVGAVREAYQFDEEEGDEFEEEEDFEEDEEDYALPVDKDQERASAQVKLDRLKSIRGTQAASAERLKVLDNIVGSQIDGEKLQQMIQAVWGASTLKKLKNAQVEELISWAKEDYFVEEAEALLHLLVEGA